ncbi:MAG: site-specific integrase [Firmicutes bacterium]|nr:site-specific integrase [Bacillota bacterium]
MKNTQNSNKKEAKEVAHAYLSWLRTTDSTKSLKTVKSYEIAINLYMKYIEEEKRITDNLFCIDKVFSIDTINEWLEYLKNKRGCSPQTCNVRLSALRSFLSYLGNKNLRYKSIVFNAMTIEKRKCKKRKVQGMSKDAVEAIINTPDTSTPTGYRDSVLISFLYTTACRINEALSIRVGELNLTARNPHVIIIGKGSKLRPLYITKKLTDNLRKYLKKFFGDNPDNSVYLFFSKIKGKNEKITQEAIGKRLKLYAKKANRKCSDVPLDLYSHTFRHTAATHMLDNGMNIVQVSKILGHESIETTMHYLDISEESIKKAMLSLVNDDIRDLPRKWKIDEGKLTKIFRRMNSK